MNNQVKGLAASFGAYLCWGFMPLYWALFGHVRGWEVIGHRVLWSLLIISALLLLLGRLEVIKSTVRGVVRSKIQLFNLFMAAVLAAVNWWINVYSVSINQVVELGIGMFLTPLISVVLGVIFFRETLSRLKWVSVILPAIGVLLMIYTFGRIPWIALGVSSTWALYGVFKKRLGIDPWVSNLLEASLMLPFACAYLYYLWTTGQGAFIAGGTQITWLLISVGLVTSVPMILFSAAANYLPMSILGFTQYLNPILTLLVGLVFFNEPFDESRLIPLCFIWSGIVLFIYAELRSRPKAAFRIR
ncbi:EamA family transporter RarD [Parasutterella muris]|uniref:EamA family transporter RarD n=1 Tax=Parasutterella muris TaxID=2565572 RepID=A0A6L6YJ77_9BURK|nr:EamA family transporter RarD [Parasutterella muris]MVX57424.1 EamA family transporter RarD [Parasutterella muris]